MRTTTCILLLAAAAWGQQVAVPQGGSLGPSSRLSDAASMSADKVDGSHSSSTPGASTVPVAGSNGKLAPGWIPLPTSSSIGGIFMDADCLTGNHVSGIDAASGRLECSADAADWSTIANKPAAFPPDISSQAWQDLLAALALKAPQAAVDAKLAISALDSTLIVSKFNGGACAGYLKSDGSCDTPSESEGTPSLDETSVSGAVYSSKPLKVAGTQTDMEVVEGAPVEVAGENHWSVDSATHRPAYSYNGGVANKVAFMGETIAATNVSGLGDAAVKNTGTSAGTVAAGDDSRITGAAPLNSPTFTGTVAVAGTQTDFKATEGTPVVTAGETHFSFNSATHHPAYSYNGGAAKDVMLAGDASSYTLPALTASTLGGVKGNGGLTCTGSQKMTGFASDGTIQCADDQTGTSSGWYSHAAPTYDYDTDTYSNDQSITITCATGTPYYTTNDGTTISEYSGAVAITATGTVLKSRCAGLTRDPSSAKSATYTLQGATPTFSADTGAAQDVTISSDTTGGKICYRTDGSDPSAATAGTCDGTSTEYTAAVHITASTTFKAIETKASYVNSAVGTGTYTIGTGSTQVASDDFSGTVTGNLGANWTADWGAFGISAAHTAYVVSAGTGGQALEHWSGAGTFTDKQYSQVTFVSAINSTYQGGGPAVRISGTSGYFVYAHNSTSLSLRKVVNGGAGSILCSTDTSPYPVTAGDTIRLEADGNVLTVKRISPSPATLGTCTDSSSPLTTGLPGLGSYSTSSDRFDDWSGGNL